MPRKPDERMDRAKGMYLEGVKLIDIAEQLGLPEGTVRRWKCTYGWDSERSEQHADSERSETKANVRKRKRGAQPGNHNASGGPPGNKKAEKYGFFDKYLPEETREIFNAIEHADPLDILWHQIQLAYAAVIRAQKIAHVKDRDDKSVDLTMESESGTGSARGYTVQQAWDKQAAFLNAQARAQGELRNLIKLYEELLAGKEGKGLAAEERKARIAQMKANTARLEAAGGAGPDGGGVVIVDDIRERAAGKHTD